MDSNVSVGITRTVQTISGGQRGQLPTQLCGSVRRRSHRIYVVSFVGVHQVDIQHTDGHLVALELRRFRHEESRSDWIARHVPNPHVHVTTILAESPETHVQRFFRRFVGIARVRFDDHRWTISVGRRLNDCHQVARNVDVLSLSIQHLKRDKLKLAESSFLPRLQACLQTLQ